MTRKRETISEYERDRRRRLRRYIKSLYAKSLAALDKAGKGAQAMNQKEMLSAITARHDQDEAEGRDWFASLPVDDQKTLWDYINKAFSDSLTEAMSRLAILQFERFAMEAARPPAPEVKP